MKPHARNCTCQVLLILALEDFTVFDLTETWGLREVEPMSQLTQPEDSHVGIQGNSEIITQIFGARLSCLFKARWTSLLLPLGKISAWEIKWCEGVFIKDEREHASWFLTPHFNCGVSRPSDATAQTPGCCKASLLLPGRCQLGWIYVSLWHRWLRNGSMKACVPCLVLSE